MIIKIIIIIIIIHILHFLLKQLTETHKYIATIFNKLIEEDSMPEWLMTGVTYLIPKNENTENPKNYRPVTCLSTHTN
jgi:regulator of protease activity HflC (stomatin/prohibitin superfamily)